MKKNELLDAMARAAGISKTAAKKAYDAFLGTVALEIRESGRSQVDGLGVFLVTSRPARIGRNPATGEPVSVPAKKALIIRPAPELKTAAYQAAKAA